MNERIQQFLAAENISQAQFAETLGVSKASISHIISGRNKPGTDFLVSLLQHYPELNIDWILTGKGKMYRERKTVNFLPKDVDYPGQDFPQEAQLFDSPATAGVEPEPFTSSQESQICPPDAQPAANTKSTEGESVPDKAAQAPEKERHITKIVVFFDDNTFEEIR